MAFWEVHTPLGGLFPRSCLKGAGWDGGRRDGGGSGGPVGVGTPAAPPPTPLHGHVKVGVFAGKRQKGDAANTGWHGRQAGAEREDQHEGGLHHLRERWGGGMERGKA